MEDLARARKPGSGLCKEGRPLKGSLRVFCLWRPKTVSRLASEARPETRFACDRDRFACKSFERNGNNDGQLGTMWVALYSILVLLAMFLWI